MGCAHGGFEAEWGGCFGGHSFRTNLFGRVYFFIWVCFGYWVGGTGWFLLVAGRGRCPFGIAPKGPKTLFNPSGEILGLCAVCGVASPYGLCAWWWVLGRVGWLFWRLFFQYQFVRQSVLFYMGMFWLLGRGDGMVPAGRRRGEVSFWHCPKRTKNARKFNPSGGNFRSRCGGG